MLGGNKNSILFAATILIGFVLLNTGALQAQIVNQKVPPPVKTRKINTRRLNAPPIRTKPSERDRYQSTRRKHRQSGHSYETKKRFELRTKGAHDPKSTDEIAVPLNELETSKISPVSNEIQSLETEIPAEGMPVNFAERLAGFDDVVEPSEPDSPLAIAKASFIQELPNEQDEQAHLQKLFGPLGNYPIGNLYPLPISDPELYEPENKAETLFGSFDSSVTRNYVNNPRQLQWQPKKAMWAAPATYHRQLYFEEIAAERHGIYSPGIQPLLSAAHFFATIPRLPLLGLSQPSQEPVFTLRHDRPGTAVPAYRVKLPWRK